MTVHEVNHPLAQHLLTKLRDKTSSLSTFRYCCKMLSRILILEATKNISTSSVTVQTPVTSASGLIATDNLIFVPILRAALGCLDVALELFPEAKAGFVGMERQANNCDVQTYYVKIPKVDNASEIYLLDPMLATGNSLSAAITLLKEHGAKIIKCVCIISAPEGIAAVLEKHPEITLYTCKVDEKLNEKNYIVPGLGDFGDRLYTL